MVIYVNGQRTARLLADAKDGCAESKDGWAENNPSNPTNGCETSSTPSSQVDEVVHQAAVYNSVSPTKARVHSALILAQVCWGAASVTNRLGLSATTSGLNPLVFGLCREACAAPLLLIVGFSRRREHDSVLSLWPTWRHLLCGFVPGLFIFLDQLCMLCGLTIADSSSAAVWQPSQVAFTAMMSVALRTESCTYSMFFGVWLTLGGGVLLSILEPDGHAGDQIGGQPNNKWGQLFFCCNCLASSCTVIALRWVLTATNASATIVTAQCYFAAACCMVIASLIVNSNPKTAKLFCPDCDELHPWRIPSESIYAIAYSIIFQTVLAYNLQSWAARHAVASTVSLYSALQPVVSIILSSGLLISGINPNNALVWPGWNLLGAPLILCGLYVATRHVKTQDPSRSMVYLRNSHIQSMSVEPPEQHHEVHSGKCESSRQEQRTGQGAKKDFVNDASMCDEENCQRI